MNQNVRLAILYLIVSLGLFALLGWEVGGQLGQDRDIEVVNGRVRIVARQPPRTAPVPALLPGIAPPGSGEAGVSEGTQGAAQSAARNESVLPASPAPSATTDAENEAAYLLRKTANPPPSAENSSSAASTSVAARETSPGLARSPAPTPAR